MIRYSSITAKGIRECFRWAALAFCWLGFLASVILAGIVIGLINYSFINPLSEFCLFSTLPGGLSLFQKTMLSTCIATPLSALVISLEWFFFKGLVKFTLFTHSLVIEEIRQSEENFKNYFHVLLLSVDITPASTEIMEPLTENEITLIENSLKDTENEHKIVLYKLLQSKLFAPQCIITLEKMLPQKMNNSRPDEIHLWDISKVSEEEVLERKNRFILAVQTRETDGKKSFSLEIAQHKYEMKSGICATDGNLPSVGKNLKYKISPENTKFYEINYIPPQESQKAFLKELINGPVKESHQIIAVSQERQIHPHLSNLSEDQNQRGHFTCQIFEELKKELRKVYLEKEPEIKKEQQQQLQQKQQAQAMQVESFLNKKAQQSPSTSSPKNFGIFNNKITEDSQNSLSDGSTPIQNINLS